MKIVLITILYVALFYLFFTVSANAQGAKDSNTSVSQQFNSANGLFEKDEIFDITLRGNIRELLNDRSATPQYHPLLLLYRNKDGDEISIAAKAKTRGHFRKLKENCTYPPLLLHFSKKDQPGSSIFKQQKKTKLVVPCQGDEYVIYEWLVYKIYNLVTPKSFRARLARIKLEDTKYKKTQSPLYAILLEEEEQMAKRNAAVPVNRKIKPEQIEPDAFLTMAVFEYLIGNTDWSVQYRQNIKLIAADSNAVPIPVPYDFDHSGLVNAPYAIPAEALKLSSGRERRYRGYCIQDMKEFDGVIAVYNRLKKDIYNVYTGCPLLNAKYVKATVKYLDEFYATINNPIALKKEFKYPCDKNGTGNVVIKGLRDD